MPLKCTLNKLIYYTPKAGTGLPRDGNGEAAELERHKKKRLAASVFLGEDVWTAGGARLRQPGRTARTEVPHAARAQRPRAETRAERGLYLTSRSSISNVRSFPASGWFASSVTVSSVISATITLNTVPLGCFI
jgi:hypothetical protein